MTERRAVRSVHGIDCAGSDRINLERLARSPDVRQVYVNPVTETIREAGYDVAVEHRRTRWSPHRSMAWDFVVVGAGPAGSRAAELLAGRGASVLMLDPRAPWEKPCGGGLTAAALRNTPDLRELDDEAETIREIQAVAPSGASVVIPLREPYHVVSRLSLSRWGLRRAAAAGVEFVPLAARSVERDSKGWRVGDEAEGVHRARWLVVADGAASPLRRRLAPRLEPELAPLRVAYTADGAPPGRAVFRLLSAVEGYLWDFPRIGHHSVGVGVPPRTFGRADLDAVVEQYRLAETGETEAVESRGAVLATALWTSGGFEDLGGRDFALLGDAAGLADPATGEGIDYALRSAALAAEAFDPALGFSRYPQAARDAFEAEIRRARSLRAGAYRSQTVEALVRWARSSRRGAAVLASLADAVNEHRPLPGAVLRGVFGRRVPEARPDQVACDCGSGLCTVDEDASWRQRLEIPLQWPADGEESQDLRSALGSLPGVTQSRENRLSQNLVLELDPERSPLGAVLGVLELAAPGEVPDPLRWHIRLGRTGCARCAAKLRASVGAIRGVSGTTVDRVGRRVTLELHPGDLDEDALAEVLAAQGLGEALVPAGAAD
jgi:flavin-dependent dehydrogenase